MRAGALGGERALPPRGGLAALLALALVAVLVAAHALGPALFGKVTLQNELAVQLRATSGLRITAHHARFGLLPRPRVTAGEVRIEDGSGALVVEAAGMTGEVRLLPLLVGRIELSGATLLRPAIVIDLRAGAAADPLASDSTIGRALSGREERADPDAQRLGSLALQDGTVRITRGEGAPLVLDGVDAAIDWSAPSAAASLTGSLRLDGERIDVALGLASPSALPRGDASSMALHVHSPAFDLAANGAIGGVIGIEEATDRATFGFRGHLTGDAAALGALLARASPGIGLPAPFADASLDADARIVADRGGLARIDLQKLAFRADGNGWEGTLAYRRGPRPLISATLATERLALAPFAARLPPPFGPGRSWSRAPLPLPRLGDVDLDLRLSASQLGLRPFTIAEAAVSVISRNDRLEVALIDGRFCGGSLKGRLSIGRAADALDLRGNAALAGADASTLSWDAAGRQLATGELSASVAFESRGDSLAALVAGLAGSARANLDQGDIAGLDGAGGRTAVRSLDVSARLAGGVATVEDASLAGAGMTMSGRGTLDLRDRTLDLRATRKGADTAPSTQGARVEGTTTLAVEGPFEAVAVRPVEGP